MDKPTLSFPVLAFSREQTGAQQPAAVLDDVVLQEILWITHQHVFDQVGAVQKINVEPGGPIVEDVAILGSPPLERVQRVRTSEGDIANQEMRLGTGWAEHTSATSVSVKPQQRSILT